MIYELHRHNMDEDNNAIFWAGRTSASIIPFKAKKNYPEMISRGIDRLCFGLCFGAMGLSLCLLGFLCV